MAETPLILIIEDSPTMLEQIAKTLEISGFRTRRATSAFEAVSVVKKERPDLIVADVGLPDMDGATATSLLKDDEVYSKVPVVLVSGLPEPELKEKGIHSGAAEILPKPFTPGDLVRCVRRCLSGEGNSQAIP